MHRQVALHRLLSMWFPCSLSASCSPAAHLRQHAIRSYGTTARAQPNGRGSSAKSKRSPPQNVRRPAPKSKRGGKTKKWPEPDADGAAFPLSRYAASHAPPGSRRSTLHEELLDFAWRCSPTPADVELADLSARAIELAWRRCGGTPSIRVVPFGSQPCGLALPGGDLDVYIHQVDTGSPLKPRNILLKVKASLDSTQTFIGGSQFIDARVPIVTGTLLGGMRTDISVRTSAKDITADGGVALMQECISVQTHARPLVLFIKALLKQAALHKVFKGGLSSFTVVNMVAALLQHEAVAGARRLQRLPPRSRQPSTERMFAALRPEELPGALAQLARLDAGATQRLGFVMVQAASAGWHLPAATLLEQHAHSCAQEPLPAELPSRATPRRDAGNGANTRQPEKRQPDTRQTSVAAELSAEGSADGRVAESTEPWQRRRSEDIILPPAAAAPMHAPHTVDLPTTTAAPSVWDDLGDPGAGAAESTAPAKRARWTRRRGAAAADSTSPGLAAALERLEEARGAMEAGPDMGDLLLDFLHRFGRGWDPARDSVHLARPDPLSDYGDGGGYREAAYESDGEMDLDEMLDADERSDLVKLFSGHMTGADIDDIDPAFFSGSDGESDEEAGPRAADTADMDLPGAADWAMLAQGRQAEKGQRSRGGDAARRGRQAMWRGGRGGGPGPHYTVLSPFEPPASAQNVASASYEGGRVSRFFHQTLRDVSKDVRWKSPPPTSARTRRVQAAVAAVRALVVYRGALPAEERAALLRACQRGLLVSAGRRGGSGHLKTVEASQRDIRKTTRKLREQLEKRGKGDVKFRMKARNKITKLEKRMSALEDTVEDIINGRRSAEKAASGSPEEAGTGLKRWGDVLRGMDSGQDPASAQKGGKKKKKRNSGEGDEEAGLEDDDEAVQDMYRIADELAEVLCQQRESEAIAKCAHAACFAARHSGRTKGGSDLTRYIDERGPVLEALLQQRHNFLGPSGTEAWLMRLREGELREIAALAEWALERAQAGGWLGGDSEGVEGVVLDCRPGAELWRWDRARLAVDPDMSYRILGGALDLRDTLALPFERQHAMLARRPAAPHADAPAAVDGPAVGEIAAADLLHGFDTEGAQGADDAAVYVGSGPDYESESESEWDTNGAPLLAPDDVAKLAGSSEGPGGTQLRERA
eukprot:jgi/Ulvmu1/4242/UM192_0001.1